MPACEMILEKFFSLHRGVLYSGTRVLRGKPVDPLFIDPKNSETRTTSPAFYGGSQRGFISCRNHAAPCGISGIPQLHLRQELASDGRVNAIAADEQIGLIAVTVRKVGDNLAVVLLETDAATPQ